MRGSTRINQDDKGSSTRTADECAPPASGGARDGVDGGAVRAANDNESQRWQREQLRRAGIPTKEPAQAAGLSSWLKPKAAEKGGTVGTATAATTTNHGGGGSHVNNHDTNVESEHEPNDWGVQSDSKDSFWPLNEHGNKHVFRPDKPGGRWAALFSARHKGCAWQRARRAALACGVRGEHVLPHLQRCRTATCGAEAAAKDERQALQRLGTVRAVRTKRAHAHATRAAEPAASAPQPAPTRAARASAPSAATALGKLAGSLAAAGAATACAPTSGDVYDVDGTKGIANADSTTPAYDPNALYRDYRLHRSKKFDFRQLIVDHDDAEYDFAAQLRLEQKAALIDTPFGRSLRKHLAERGHEAIRRSSFKLPALLQLLQEDDQQQMGGYIYINCSRGYDVVPADVGIPASECDNYTSATEDYPEHVTKDIERLLEHEFVMPWDLMAEEIGCDDAKPHIVHSLGAVMRNGKIRIVIDASSSEHDGEAVNDFAEKDGKTCFATVDQAKLCMSRKGRMARCDLRDAFLQTPLSERSIKLCGFRWKGKYYAYRTLGFGFSRGPYWQQLLATCLCRATLRHVAALGLDVGQLPEYEQHQVVSPPPVVGESLQCILALLDDFFFAGTSLKATHFAWCRFMYITGIIGIVVSPKPGKTDGPCRLLVYLGIELCLDTMTAKLHEERVVEMRRRLHDFKDRGAVSKKELQSLIGVLVFASCVIRCGRPAYRHLLDLLRGHTGGQRSKITLDAAARGDLTMWDTMLTVINATSAYTGVRMPTARWHFSTDASYSGYGWHAGCGIYDYGKWPASWAERMGDSKYRSIWVTEAEILCIAFALRRLAPLLANSRVHLHCDNLGVVYILRKHSSRSARCAAVVAEIEWCCAVWNIELIPHHIRTYDNKLADLLSRIPEPDFDHDELEGVLERFGEECAQRCPLAPRRCAMARPDLLPLLQQHTVQLDLWENELTAEDAAELERLLPQYLRNEQLSSAVKLTGVACASERARELVLIDAAKAKAPNAKKRRRLRQGRHGQRKMGDRGALDKGATGTVTRLQES